MASRSWASRAAAWSACVAARKSTRAARAATTENTTITAQPLGTDMAPAERMSGHVPSIQAMAIAATDQAVIHREAKRHTQRQFRRLARAPSCAAMPLLRREMHG
jgi:hypothetical protein